MDFKLATVYRELASSHHKLAEYFESLAESPEQHASAVAEVVHATPKPKKERDPDAPKRPATSFLLFAKEMRSQFVKDHPEIPPNMINKELGNYWKTVDQTKWEDEARFLKVSYDHELEAYEKGKKSPEAEFQDDESEIDGDETGLTPPVTRISSPEKSSEKKPKKEMKPDQPSEDVKPRSEKVEKMEEMKKEKLVELKTESPRKEKRSIESQETSESPKKKKKKSKSIDQGVTGIVIEEPLKVSQSQTQPNEQKKVKKSKSDKSKSEIPSSSQA